MSFQFNADQVKAYHASTEDELIYFNKIFDGPFFKGAASVLDAGCGEGKVTACIAEKFPSAKVVGFDASKAMIKFASQHYCPPKYPNLNFFEKDICALGKENEFDRAISFNCLHWIKDQRLALDSIYKSLKKGGKALLIASPKVGTVPCDLHAMCREVMISFKWLFRFFNFKSEHSFHTESGYRKILNSIGFSIDRIEMRTKPVVFQDRKELDAFLNAVVTPINHLSEEKKPAFLNDLYAVLVKKGKVKPNGQIHIEVGQIEILASKE